MTNGTTFGASALSTATPDAVYDVWTDVARWVESDEIQRASIDRDFGPGAVITNKARGFPTSTLVVTEVERPRRWVDESRQPGLTMTFEHTAIPCDGGTTVTEAVTFSGPLARLVATVVRRRLLRLMTASTNHVAKQAAGS